MLPQGRGPQGTGHRWQAWASCLTWSSNHLSPGLRPWPPAGSRIQSHQIPVFLGDGMRISKQLTETLCFSCLCSRVPRAVCNSPAAPLQPVMRRPAPGRVTPDPLTSPITIPSCLSGLALPAQVGGRGPPPGSLGRALVPGGGRKGPLGSENSQETQNWEQQQQQETEGAGSGPPLPP